VTFPEGILWKADRDGGNPVQLTDKPWYPKLPRWSPDGSQILFFDNDQNGVNRVYIIPSIGGNPASLLPEVEGSPGDPSWSPDGKKVAFAVIETVGGTVDRHLGVLDFATRKVSTIPGSHGGVSPRWSPDGRFIAALFNQPTELRVYDFESQKWTLLRKQETGFPSWSRDGRYLYFWSLNSNGDWAGYRMRPTGGAAELVFDLSKTRLTGVYGPWLGLDPDDNLLMLRETGSDDIYALSLERR
jgi:Tol biopolymer transport system component